MVDLAKIRKKAKSQSSADNRQPTTDNATAKLEAFLATVNQKRPGLVQETVAPPQDEVQLLTFTLGAERYAIEIDDIAEIIGAQTATPIHDFMAGRAGVIC